MINTTDTAFPRVESAESIYTTPGLTIRQYFAARAMQGILANCHIGGNGYDSGYISNLAITHGDALIEELNKTQ